MYIRNMERGLLKVLDEAVRKCQNLTIFDLGKMAISCIIVLPNINPSHLCLDSGAISLGRDLKSLQFYKFLY